ncbi:hypothetical protein Francci3_3297 [Frankia casuarinae]|uniref:Uncharacterized protein n=1 Tax=Frankia casuarinae (strain DSM 45818 / CECT 9043 / HFP020203 / CcI3) TaxID=106370 RepID=Q2J7T8_FRACC|nr:hypothetical protein Francci3_3297 [Frankia casuarinae]
MVPYRDSVVILGAALAADPAQFAHLRVAILAEGGPSALLVGEVGLRQRQVVVILAEGGPSALRRPGADLHQRHRRCDPRRGRSLGAAVRRDSKDLHATHRCDPRRGRSLGAACPPPVSCSSAGCCDPRRGRSLGAAWDTARILAERNAVVILAEGDPSALRW